MRKFCALILAFMIVFSSFSALAQDSIGVLLDGRPIEFDVEPQIINSRTMVPMRAIFNALGASVDWVGEHQLIIAVKNTSIITMMIAQPIMHIGNLDNEEQRIVELDSPPIIVNDRTLVPIRAISEALGVYVDWEQETRTVILSTEQIDKNEELTENEE